MVSQGTRIKTQDAARTHTPLGWLTVLVNLGYATCGYYGFAPPPGGMPTRWWHGHGFILDLESMGPYVDNPALGALLFGIPALCICVATFFTTRSAIARMLSLTFSLMAILTAAMGYSAAGPWMHFSWRFTAILSLTSISLAAASTAPWLVESWLRLSWARRFAIYLPICFGAMAAVRGATGTSEQMRFMVSPWPMFTSFGLDAGVLVVSGFLFSVALGALSLSRRTLDSAAAVGLSIALCVPSIWIALGVSELSATSVLASSLVAASLIAACWMHRGTGERRVALLRRGYHAGLAAVLVFVPVFSGHTLAAGDYTVNRYIRGPRVIDALQRHIESEEFYPTSLDGLVSAGYLDQTPKPRIGFGFLEQIGLSDEVKYRYSEFGSSFVIEFDSISWVQCAFTGNYYFEDEEGEDEDDAYEEDTSGWTCLGNQPSLISERSDPDADIERDDAYEED